jgi:Streptomyces sporulation and cell division protein, SsgA
VSAPGSRAVSAEVSILLVAPGQMVPLIASLSYSDDDPYAVRAAFHVGLDEPVGWIFARDLLAAGSEGREGIGDVRVWPCDDGRALRIAVSSPFGDATFEAPAADVAAFLARTWQLVPAGGEPGHVDVDAELGRLLAEGGPW